MRPERATAYLQEPNTLSATIGMRIAAIEEPQLPRPASTPWAKPMSLGLNHREVMWMPTTKPVPTIERRSLETSIWVYELANAKAKQGMAITIMTIVKVFLGPSLSESMPMMTRPGMVRATLVTARRFKCCLVKPDSCAIIVASGAMLNQTKNVRKKASHVLWRATMSILFRSKRGPH